VKYVLEKQGTAIYTNVFAGLGSEVEPSAIAEMTATASRNCTINLFIISAFRQRS